ncbi:MAG: Re/Si-specific NAD(P)(+) transhydrogenase subunit alpha [Gammaproteobacteria bacterium]|nr:Re/Si-specific NAD(P)(+) transhydrogenase subunit alpha [Gammaproteobacteria bacterium]
MAVKAGVPRETQPGERRVALNPGAAERLAKLGVQVLLQKGAGEAAQIPDRDYGDAVTLVDDAHALYQQADMILKVQPPTIEEIDQMRDGAVVIGYMSPHLEPDRIAKLRDRNITAFSMEFIPRISRAQSMDALSSQAAVAGYKAAIMGADLSNRFFPMLTTAAGTIRPAKVLVIGAGVAGLQAIATARRLGAQVEAYDVRAATKEQVQSLGAKFLETKVAAEGEGGYARELNEEEKQQQQETLADHIAKAQVVITTAAIPGKASPRIIPKDMVEGMQPGGVIIDLAAEGGGNCELSKPGETVNHSGVIIHAPLNVPSQVPFHASEMYAKNLLSFLQPMIADGEWKPDWDDEVIAKSVLTHAGAIRHEPTRVEVEDKQQ